MGMFSEAAHRGLKEEVPQLEALVVLVRLLHLQDSQGIHRIPQKPSQ